MSDASCSGAEGTCERPVEKAGLCAAHRARKKGRSKKSLAEPVQERATSFRDGSTQRGWAKFNPIEGLIRAFTKYRDELDTATEEEFLRSRELIRDALRRRDWVYIPAWLRRQTWSADPKTDALVKEAIEQRLKTFGDKAKHAAPRKQHKHHPHLQHPPTQFGPRSTK